MAKNVVIIGSTGSIGKSALDLFDKVLKDYTLLGISANENIDELKKQIKKYEPKYAAIMDKSKEKELKDSTHGTKILAGYSGLVQLASLKEADIVLISVVGAVGLIPLMAAIKAGKKIALANKESLIIAGDVVNAAVEKYGAEIIPVDSEHSAIFQCLQGNKREQVKRLIITASGGAFKNHTIAQLKKVTVAQALNHPTWKMGKKITVDSGTLMNKGLEVIEAHYLFDMPYEKISVVIHPQSIIHSMVEYVDGSIIAQLSNPDMRLAILYALTYPDRCRGVIEPLDFVKTGKLEFCEVDLEKYKAFSLALKAGKDGGSMPACMNAANEIAVKNFIEGKIPFVKIADIVEKVMKSHKKLKEPTLEDILKIDLKVRLITQELING